MKTFKNALTLVFFALMISAFGLAQEMPATETDADFQMEQVLDHEIQVQEPEVIVINGQHKVIFEGSQEDFKNKSRLYKAEFLVSIGDQQYYLMDN